MSAGAVGFFILGRYLSRRFGERVAVVAAGLTRPNGFLVFVPCLIASIVEIRRNGWQRVRSSVLTPLMAPLGFVAWVAMVYTP
jgi:hypothetical protein